MNVPSADHPVWPVARVALMLLALGLCLALGYSSNFDAVKDLRTMIVVGVLSGLAEGVKRMIAPPEPKT